MEPTTDNATADLQQYSREWYDKMVKIWRDRIDLFGCIRTGALRSSVAGGNFSLKDYDLNATFHFLQYGLYVDAGVGNGYRPGEGLAEHIDKTYRRTHKHYKKARKRRPWFTNSWYISREVLKDKFAEIIGEAFAGAFSEIGTVRKA